ncbi:MAG: HD domain-containing protein [Nanoarchaeota archaeon]|nr:HD domain-containing protein [Nanoarchaeota archaeon]MBU2458807.1 HD domain-containing protein [Nanoarchaeota archaeon]
MDKNQILKETENYIRNEMGEESTGHDWFHIERVLNNATKISEKEGGDLFIIKMAALLHDIGDPKLYDGDKTAARRIVGDWLKQMGVEGDYYDSILNIAENISFSKSLENKDIEKTKEFMIVQDADRLDAIGAICIARVFHYGGSKGRKIYNPSIKPRALTSKNYSGGINESRDSFSHFYEKIILLKDLLNTPTSKKIGEKRHKFIEVYLDQFLNEWNSEDF